MMLDVVFLVEDLKISMALRYNKSIRANRNMISTYHWFSRLDCPQNRVPTKKQIMICQRKGENKHTNASKVPPLFSLICLYQPRFSVDKQLRQMTRDFGCAC